MRFPRRHIRALRRRFSVVLSAAILLALSAAPAAAQPNVTGSAEALTDGDEFFTAPAWSPDGSRLAFSAARYEGIYVLDLETGTVRTVTDAPGAGFGFEWAPDGSRILAREAQFDGPRRFDAVTVFDPEGGSPERLTEFRTDMPALPTWDASGANVVLYANNELEVFAVRDDIEIGKRSPVAVITAAGGLARIDAESRSVEPFELLQENQVLNPAASPDGGRIAFEVMGGNLHVAGTDGSGLIDLGPGHRPAWSPDGEWIVFMRTQDDGHTFTESDLYAVRHDGSNLVRLTATPNRLEMNPAWSPDGSRIAYDDFTDGIIYLLPISY